MSTIKPRITSSISNSSGDWNCPSVELRQSVWEIKHISSPLVVEGSVGLDTRFFKYPPSCTSTPFAITIALTSPGSLRPLDWNQEESKHTGMTSGKSNPESCIAFGERIIVDEELCYVSFTITLPSSVGALCASAYPDIPAIGSAARRYGVAVKAYDGKGRMTQTNIAQFVIRSRGEANVLASIGQTTTVAALASRRISAVVAGRRRLSMNKDRDLALALEFGRFARQRRRGGISVYHAGTRRGGAFSSCNGTR